MNAKFSKLISSAAAVLAVGSSAYAQTKTCPPVPCTPTPAQFEQGYEVIGDKFPAAYNAASRIDVCNSWDFFLSGSFLYWHASQEAMDIAVPVSGGSVLFPKVEYKPGFNVGLGMNFDHDNWVGVVEYTWFHQKTSRGVVVGAWDMSNWYAVDPIHVTGASSKWLMNLDLLDASFSRPFYQGKDLSILPFGGLRAAWIRQNLRIGAHTAATTLISHNQSHSWAIGPRAGLQAHWMLGWGFRFEGDVSGSLLYTRYTKITHRDDTSVAIFQQPEYNVLRPGAEMAVGLGWGSYFDRQNYHFDLLANYVWNQFWGQNVMRGVATLSQGYGEAYTPGDLQIHGLTVTARFDF